MEGYKSFELIRGKYYKREEVETFRNTLLREYHELETNCKLMQTAFEQVMNVLRERGIECKGPYQLANVLNEQLAAKDELAAINQQLTAKLTQEEEKHKTAIADLQAQLAAYQAKENIIQQSILEAQSTAEQVITKARQREEAIIANALRKDREVNQKIDRYLYGIVEELMTRIEQVNQETMLYKKMATGLLQERLANLEKEIGLLSLQEMGENLLNDVREIKEILALPREEQEQLLVSTPKTDEINIPDICNGFLQEREELPPETTVKHEAQAG